jgi:hypothetical protein
MADKKFDPKKHPRYSTYIVMEIVFGVSILAALLGLALYLLLS